MTQPNITTPTTSISSDDQILALCVSFGKQVNPPLDLYMVWTECATPDQHELAVSVLTALKEPMDALEYDCCEATDEEGYVADDDGDMTIGHMDKDPAKPCIYFCTDKTPIDVDIFLDDVMKAAQQSEYMEPVYRQ